MPSDAPGDSAADRTADSSLPTGSVLRLPAFRRLWVGLGLSSLGDWLGLLALTAMANQLADSYASRNYAIAGVLLLRVLPALVVGPLAGYIADRTDRRTVLIWGDVIRGLLFLSIPLVGTLTWVFVVTVLVEVVSLVWGPAKDATVPNLVPRGRLEAANQLSLATTYGSAVPAAALFSLLTLGERLVPGLWSVTERGAVDVALYLNGISFLVSGLVIARIHGIPRGPADTHGEGGLVAAVLQGWSYVVGTPVIRGLVTGMVGAFAAGGVVVGLARTLVADLGGGDSGYGVLFGAVFTGMGLGLWRGPRLLSRVRRRRVFGAALIGCGLVLVPLALVPHLELVVLMAVAVGFLAGSAWVTGLTLLGTEVPDQLRGRTFAFVTSAVRLALALVLALAPLVAGAVGSLSLGPQTAAGQPLLVYRGAAVTILLAAVLMVVVGVVAYRQMDDHGGPSLLTDLGRAVRPDAAATPGGLGGAAGPTPRGVFVAFEGGEGAGKSTQATRLAAWLRARGHDVVLTREPGDTGIGRQLRSIVLDPASGMSHRTELLLYAADKAEHVDRVVLPALDRGAVVVTDRYVDSTLAYQGAGRDLPDEEVERIARWATTGLRPHLTVLLDLEPEAGLTRFEERDRIEAESLDFHRRVRDGFLRLAAERPEDYVVLDARAPADELEQRIRVRVEPLLPSLPADVPLSRPGGVR